MISFFRSPRVVFALIFLLAVAVRIPLMPSADGPAYGEAVWVARSLVATGEFANPFGTPTGPTAHVAPVYAGLLSLILRVFPYDAGFHQAIILLALCLSSLGWAVLPHVGSRIGLPRVAAVLAGVLGALYPLHKGTELDGSWEAPLLAPLFAILCAHLFTLDWEDRGKSVTAALGMGLLMLTQPVVAGPWIGILCVLVVQRRARPRQALLALIVSMLVLAPWTVRNVNALGGFCFVRSNLGLELWISNGPWAKPSLAENLQFGQREKTVPHPDVNPAEALKMREMGELGYNRLRLREALAWMGANPVKFAKLTAQRTGNFLAPPRRSLMLRAVEASVVALALAGMALLLLRRTQCGWMLLAVWVTMPPIYLLLQSDERYRYPMEWSIFLCAAFAVTEVASRLRILAADRS